MLENELAKCNVKRIQPKHFAFDMEGGRSLYFCLFVVRYRTTTTPQEDVRRLGQMHFLRLDGARDIGIRTSFGVPVVSRWGVTFVIVFYSRTAVQVRSRFSGFGVWRVARPEVHGLWRILSLE